MYKLIFILFTFSNIAFAESGFYLNLPALHYFNDLKFESNSSEGKIEGLTVISGNIGCYFNKFLIGLEYSNSNIEFNSNSISTDVQFQTNTLKFEYLFLENFSIGLGYIASGKIDIKQKLSVSEYEDKIQSGFKFGLGYYNTFFYSLDYQSISFETSGTKLSGVSLSTGLQLKF